MNNFLTPEILDKFESFLKIITSNLKTKAQQDSALDFLNEFIKQIDTQIQLAQSEYSDFKNLYEQVLEAQPHAIWILNSDGSYFYYNSYALKIEAILSHAPKDFSECEIFYNKEYYLLKTAKNNTRKVITAINITNEKQKDRLALMGQISAHLAHEIRNPIGAINLILSSLLKNIDSAQKIYVLEMKKALWRVERLINTTLLFSKGVTSSIATHKSSIIKDLILQSIEYIEFSKNIDFIYAIKSNEIACDKELLEILLQNLVLNAIDAIEESESSQNGEIKIEFYKQNEAQILKIYDNGIPFSDTENIFDAFVTTKIKGNGLGLALCKQIAQAHNGEISCQNANLSENKHFCIVF